MRRYDAHVEVQRDVDRRDPARGRGRRPDREVIPTHGIGPATYFTWKAKYANATVPELARLRDLDQENARLKRMYADLALENTAIKDVLSRKL